MTATSFQTTVDRDMNTNLTTAHVSNCWCNQPAVEVFLGRTLCAEHVEANKAAYEQGRREGAREYAAIMHETPAPEAAPGPEDVRIAELEALLALRTHEANEAAWIADRYEHAMNEMADYGFFDDASATSRAETLLAKIERMIAAHQEQQKPTADYLLADYRAKEWKPAPASENRAMCSECEQSAIANGLCAAHDPFANE